MLGVFDERTPYERNVLPFVHPFTDGLVASVDVGDACPVLDHGSGTGEVLRGLRVAGFRGRATALEPDAGMVDRLRVNQRGEDATVFHGHLTEFVAANPDARFGLITSQLVLSFVDDPGAEL